MLVFEAVSGSLRKSKCGIQSGWRDVIMDENERNGFTPDHKAEGSTSGMHPDGTFSGENRPADGSYHYNASETMERSGGIYNYPPQQEGNAAQTEDGNDFQYNANGYASQGYAKDAYGNPMGSYVTGQEEAGKDKKKKKKKRFTAWKVAGIAAAAGVFAGAVFAGFYTINHMLDRTEAAVQALKESKESSTKDVKSEAGKSVTSQIGTTKVVDGSDLAGRDVSGIVENVMPSIVSISSKVKESAYFLGQYYGDQDATSSGSGVILDENSDELLIVTNNHVIEGASDIVVTFADEKQVEATVKGADADADLAVLSVKKDKISKDTMSKIKTIAIGNSNDLKVGEMTIAIGNALGYGQSVTVGYVSAKDRTIELDNRKSSNLIQTDAAINPGNSGGALLNDRGELIGINSAKYTSTAIEGIGYAIAITNADPMIEELKNTEKLAEDEKGYLGISCADITTAQNKKYNMPVGVFVSEVFKGSAAEEAGIINGDIITKVNGNEVQTTESLRQRVTNKRIGTEIQVTVMRYDAGEYKEKEISVKLKGAETLETEEQKEDQQKEDQQKEEQQPEQEYGNDFFGNGFPFGDFFGTY